MLIAVNRTQELFERVDRSLGLIAMPLQVCTHPEYFQDALYLHESRFGHGEFLPNASVFPVGPNLKNLNALAFHSVAKVELVARMQWRSAASHEVR